MASRKQVHAARNAGVRPRGQRLDRQMRSDQSVGRSQRLCAGNRQWDHEHI